MVENKYQGKGRCRGKSGNFLAISRKDRMAEAQIQIQSYLDKISGLHVIIKPKLEYCVDRAHTSFHKIKDAASWKPERGSRPRP